MYSRYYASFHSSYTLKEAYKLIESLTSDHENVLLTTFYRFKIESVSFDTVAAEIVLSTNPKRQLNSFTPRITVSIWEADKGSNLLMEFEANPSLRTFSFLFDLACIVFQVIAISSVIKYKESFHFHVFIPICMMIAEHVFSPIYLDSTIKELWNELYTYLTGDVDNIPKLIKTQSGIPNTV